MVLPATTLSVPAPEEVFDLISNTILVILYPAYPVKVNVAELPLVICLAVENVCVYECPAPDGIVPVCVAALVEVTV